MAEEILLHKNDKIILKITAMSAEGSGIGRHNGMAVFVPFSAIGDTVQAHILKVLKHMAYGKIIKIIESSPDRIQPDCNVFGQCGGCVYRHVSYEAELKYKQARVTDALERIGGLSIVPDAIVGADTDIGYRNKAQYPVARDENGFKIGFFSPRSHRIIDSRRCQLHPPVFLEAVEIIETWMARYDISAYDEAAHTGLVRHIYFRMGMARRELMVCMVINGRFLPYAHELMNMLRAKIDCLSGLIININHKKTNVILGATCKTVFGKGTITDILCGLEFNISPLAFYQVNHGQTEKLYRIVSEFAQLSGKEMVVDLYCGAGTIGISLASQAGNVIGIEVIPEAIENARKNVAHNQINNISFICGDASDAARALREKGVAPDVVVLDPPRKGCSPALIVTVAEMRPKRIVYVSCDPATLARDIKLFEKNGYKCQEVKPVDMFPRTAHVECVCLLSKM